MKPKEEKKYPRVMWVWDDQDGKKRKYKRVVVCEYGGKFIASDYVANTLEEFFKELEFGSFVSWNYASEIEEPEMPIEEKPDKQEKKHPEKPILRKAYEIIGRLKAENLKRAGFPDSDIIAYLQADKELKEIESHLNK